MLVFAEGLPGNSFVPELSVDPNFSRARRVYLGAPRTVDMYDSPGVSSLKYAPGPCAHMGAIKYMPV